ncbi:hypothetical protein [Cetobacterium sp.]
MWIKWLVSDKTNINLKNFLIASLIMMVIGGIIVGVCSSRNFSYKWDILD